MQMVKQAKRQKVDPAVKLALTILPPIAVANGSFKIQDIANHTEQDQRRMVRSGEKRTVRRMSHIERLVARRTLTRREGALCQWYADQHEMGFATVGCTANYCGAGGGGFGTMDLLARYTEQALARDNYLEARSSISAILLPLFERIVINQLGLGEAGENSRYSRLSRSFKLALFQMDQAVGHLVAFED